MTAYWIAHQTITDPETFQTYVAPATEAVVAFGGRVLAVSDNAEVREGTAPDAMTVIVEFPSMEIARHCYESEAYQAVLPIRLASTRGSLYFIEGVAPPS